jgi:hypothetical protein
VCYVLTFAEVSAEMKYYPLHGMVGRAIGNCLECDGGGESLEFGLYNVVGLPLPCCRNACNWLLRPSLLAHVDFFF